MEFSYCLRFLLLIACLSPALVECRVRRYTFNVVMKNTTRLCSSKPIVTVNGKFPGPTLYAREDDTVLVRVINKVKYNVSIHWATVHGAIVILPKRGVPYPFPTPHKEVVVILGDYESFFKNKFSVNCGHYDAEIGIEILQFSIAAEWWKSDTEAVINQALKSGLAPNVSDAHTINGHPGTFSTCPSQGGFTLPVQSGQTYMLRIINAALNEELFFKIAGHKLTIVEVDATYVKPFKTDTILIAPGQTTNALITTDQNTGKYLVAAAPFMDSPIAVDNVTATATLHYSGTLSNAATTLTTPPPRNATAATMLDETNFPPLQLWAVKHQGSSPPIFIDHHRSHSG
ncbi:hypothetical protein HS088_TW03G01198 [Tripterygium wilfordii]|uniref:laccase n=1 Tax=Tripterygium wilfordii TaxID=458696 RepID=A0A7J7DWV4_TRIWF|nr:hypothetical protein HS088_TW03G01198 [Tripterygium wilfordii]